jgi:uncharacterized membrane protein YsdA (DUF1294 family)
VRTPNPPHSPRNTQRCSRVSLALVAFAAVVLGTLVVASLFHAVPWWFTGLYLGMSLIAFVAYGLDKSKARRGVWRTPEATLHLLEAFGGWPGALMAQRIFRHKTSKVSFQVFFWFIVTAHAAGWYWLISEHQLSTINRWFSHPTAHTASLACSKFSPQLAPRSLGVACLALEVECLSPVTTSESATLPAQSPTTHPAHSLRLLTAPRTGCETALPAAA